MKRSIFCIIIILVFVGLSGNQNLKTFSYGSPLTKMVNHDEFLYFYSDLGFVRYNIFTGDKQINDHLLEASIGLYTPFTVDFQGNYWLYTNTEEQGSGLYKFDGINMNKLNAGIYQDSIASSTCLTIDNENTLWVGTYTNGLYRYNPISCQWQMFNQETTGLSFHHINGIYQDQGDGSIWVSSWSEGLMHYIDNDWVIYNSQSGFPFNCVNDIGFASDGSIWLACSEGLFQLNGNDCEEFGDYAKIECLEVDNLNQLVYFNLYDIGLMSYRLDYQIFSSSYNSYTNDMIYTGEFTFIRDSYYLKKYSNYYSDYDIVYPGNLNIAGQISSLAYDSSLNDLWVKLGDELARYDYSGIWNYYNVNNSGINFSTVSDIIYDKDHKLWVVSQNGVYKRFISYDGVNWVILPLLPESFSYLTIESPIFDNNNKLWFHTYNDIFTYQNNVITKVSTQGFDINSKLFVDNEDNVWFVSAFNIIFKYNAVSGSFENIYDDGSAFITNLYVVNSNEFWFTNGAKLCHWDNAVISEYNIPLISYYSECEIKKDSNNKLWISSGCYLFSFDGTTVSSADIKQSNNERYNSNRFVIDREDNKCVALNTYLFMYNESGVVNDDNQVINSKDSFSLSNYPNPFNPETNISFEIESGQNLEIKIYNIKGQVVKDFANNYYSSGAHKLTWNGKSQENKSLASGVYFVSMKGKHHSATRKMLMLK